MKHPWDSTDPNEDIFDMSFQRILCCDFDGVFHGYRQGWKGPTEIYDEPVPGSFEWLEQIAAVTNAAGEKLFDPMIYSSRSKFEGGVAAMRSWFARYGLPDELLRELTFCHEKPAAWLTIDDRCFEFRGVFPTPDYLLNYTSWVSDSGTLPMKSDADLLRQIAIDGLHSNARDTGAAEILRRIADRIDGR